MNFTPTYSTFYKLPLYVITHQQLSPGYQIAQVAHAVADFAISTPELFRRWHANSQYIVSLAEANEHRLTVLRDKLSQEGFQLISFHEPDMDDALTAFALLPDHRLKKRLANLPLAGRMSS